LNNTVNRQTDRQTRGKQPTGRENETNNAIFGKFFLSQNKPKIASIL